MKAALGYGRLGWSVIPIEPRGKRPLIPWEIYQHRRTEATEVADWFQRWPDANLAVVTGAVSGLIVVDLDSRYGTDADLEPLENVNGTIPESVVALTGGGGRHLYFAHPGEILPSRAGILAGVDLLGDGGYVVAPPSVHAGGASYRWERHPDVCQLAPLPGWLRSSLLDCQIHRGDPPSDWRELLGKTAREGERIARVATLAEHLLNQGVDPEVTVELLLGWNVLRCSPPLEEEEVVRAAEAVRGAHPRGEAEGR